MRLREPEPVLVPPHRSVTQYANSLMKMVLMALSSDGTVCNDFRFFKSFAGADSVRLLTSLYMSQNPASHFCSKRGHSLSSAGPK